jgi:hypothetical protein
MAKRTARERRADRQRKKSRQASSRWGGDEGFVDEVTAVTEALRVGSMAAHSGDADTVGACATLLAGYECESAATVAMMATDLVFSVLASLYEGGWQPADVMHAARRTLKKPEALLAAAVILLDAHGADAASRAPLAWVGQLDAIGEVDAVVTARAGTGTRATWRTAAGIDPGVPGWTVILRLLGLWTALPRWQSLIPPPSAWPDRRVDLPGGADIDQDHKKLNKIRALLAKAEATEFAEEAEIFTAKAQELMTRYAIDAAMLAATAPEPAFDVRGVRVHIDNPYAMLKMQLLAEISNVNSVRAIYSEEHGIATIVGTPVELEQTELLYYSLLVQSTRAMAAAGTRSRSRTPGFRRSFLMSYSRRIGERLAEVNHRVTEDAAATEHRAGRSLIPVLAARTHAVAAEFERLFPEQRAGHMPMSYDRSGWVAGRRAADQASLTVREQVGGAVVASGR